MTERQADESQGQLVDRAGAPVTGSTLPAEIYRTFLTGAGAAA